MPLVMRGELIYLSRCTVMHLTQLHEEPRLCINPFYGQRLAGFIQSQIIRSVNTVDRGSEQRDDLWVLNGTNAVAVLVELAFIDNMDDLRLLETKFG